MPRILTPLRILPNPAPASRPSDRASIDIYRPFFLAGIVCVLTVGCLLGAVALLGISRQASYTANAWTPYVLAHANSQLFGWVGFFVMGFALQQHAPTMARRALFHRLAYASMALMVAGIALRFAAEPLVGVNRAIWYPVGIAACSLQTLAVLLFVANTQLTRHRAGEAMRWQNLFVFASLGWLLTVAVAEPFVFAFSHQASARDSILFVAGWFAPLREAQFLGFAAMMIFGVSLSKFGSCFGWRAADPRWGLIGLALWSLGLLFRIVGWRVYFASELAAGSGWAYHVGGTLLFAGALSLFASSRLIEMPKESFRSQKYVRSAYGWLLLASVLLVLEPLHLANVGLAFSHAYTGAVRHAITVGFISQMILGVGMHVVARMNGFDETRLQPLWSVFLILNLANAARVGLEIATDYSPAAFAPMGWTGFLELIALTIWALHVGGPMVRSRVKAGAYAC